MPTTPYLVYGTIKKSDLTISSNSRITFTNKGSYVTNSDGKYLIDFANIGYTSGETITYTVEDKYNNEISSGSFTLTGTSKNLDITLEVRETPILVKNNRDTQVYNIGGKSVSKDNPFYVLNQHLSLDIECNKYIYINTYLLNGTSNDMGIDGSSTPVSFNYTVPSGKKLLIGRILLYSEAATAFDSVKFLNLTALTNGISIRVNGKEITNWKDNIDMVTTMYDMEEGAAFGKATKVLRGRWSLWKAAKNINGIILTSGQKFEVVVQDDLSAAGIIFRIRIQGALFN